MTKYRKTSLIEATQWFKNGDHPDDHVGEPAVDLSKLLELHPELLSRDEPIITADIPPEAYYERIEGMVVRFFRDPYTPGDTRCMSCGNTMHDHGWIDTLEGGHPVCPGDWIATGIKGEHWNIKPDIFEATYEAVEESTPVVPELPHSRACGIHMHEHGPACSPDCPTCGSIAFGSQAQRGRIDKDLAP